MSDSSSGDVTQGAYDTLAPVGNVAGAAASVVSATVSAASFIISSLFLIGALIVLSSLMFFYVRYQDKLPEQAEKFARGKLFPLWRDDVRQYADIARDLFNGVVCWWDAYVTYMARLIFEVIFPIGWRCGIIRLAPAIGNFVLAVGQDLVPYVATGQFLTQDVNFTRITPAGIALADAWIQTYQCACFDLGVIVEAIPLLNPLIAFPAAWPVMFGLFPFSGQWKDPQTWCFIEQAINVLAAAASEVWQLLSQLIQLLILGNPPALFVRPDFRRIVNKLCRLLDCGVRSMENAIQFIWDQYVPFKFVFNKFFCIVDSLACILLKTAAVLLRFIINIDKVVNYPNDPFYEDVIKQDLIEILNLYVAPTPFETIIVPPLPNPSRFVMFDYFLDVNEPVTHLGRPNPLFNETRLSECICIFITRFICDPSDENTACFSSTAQNLLMGLDFCCITNTVLKLLADFVSGLIEFTFHFSKGADNFFLFVDNQPFTRILKDDLVGVVRCLLSVFGLIPVVGTCIRELLVNVVDYALSILEFFFKVLVGLLTLPYFITTLPSIPNFLQSANEAQDYFIAIHEKIIADAPGSFKNCLCVVLNNGFPIPPIPCSSCRVDGFVPPPASRRFAAHRSFFGPQGQPLTSPWRLAKETWLGRPLTEAEEVEEGYKVTPLIYYGNGTHTSNPVTLFNNIWINVQTLSKDVLPWKSLREVNEFVDRKQAEMLEKWSTKRKSQEEEEERLRLQFSNPKLYEFKRKRGDLGGCPATEHSLGEEHVEQIRTAPPDAANHSNAERLTTVATDPPVVGCTPTPKCFDVCCLFRSVLTLAVHIITSLARFFNGLIQGSLGIQGTMQDYPYFTGEFGMAPFNQPTFESDLIKLIIDSFVPIRCACQVFNLIIPVIPSAFTAGREDVCAFVQRLSELIACIIQTIINVINALAMGATTNYIYFRSGDFRRDINTIFDIQLATIDAICVFIRAIFPANYIPGFAEASDFDICCAAKAVLYTVTEILRLILQMVISLALITTDNEAFCFWRLDRTVDHPTCAGTLDGIGFVKQLDVVIDSFFPLEGQNGGLCKATCKNDNGASGIVPCICQIFNTLIPWRDDPSKRVNCSPVPGETNCPRLDFCCPFSKLGFFIADSLKFVIRAIVALWQPWDGLPEFFINYIFCDEGRVAPCPSDQVIPPNRCQLSEFRKVPTCSGIYLASLGNGTFVNRCGEYTCGKLNVVIKHLTHPTDGLIARCTCQFISLLDQLVALIFRLLRIILPQSGWGCCFCGGINAQTGDCNVNSVGACTIGGPGPFIGSSGLLTGLSYVVNAILVASTGFLRKFPLSCYWKPCVPSNVIPVRCPNNVPQKVDETWIFSFLAPTANALCIAVGNVQCFAQSLFLLPQICLFRGQRFLGSVVRWAAEIILRVVGFIEAFVAVFIAPDNSCVGPTCEQAPGTKIQVTKGIDAKQLGDMMVILLSIPNDLLIGDSEIACTTICPSQFAIEKPKPCDCWNKSPRDVYGNGRDAFLYTTNNTLCIDPLTNKHVGEKWFLNGTTSLVNVTINQRGTGYRVGNVLNVPGGILGSLYVTSLNGLRSSAIGTVSVANPGSGYVTGTNISVTGGDGTGATVDIINVVTGCCVPIIETNPIKRLPICINPSESLVKPGPCAELAACRPDALPSCAFDPEIPRAMTVGYEGAIDGVVMGFVKYLRCILNNVFCDSNGQNCARIGNVMRPAILIFSYVWQILGGFIRFIVACIIFFFTLFTPPEGGDCDCYDSAVQNGFGKTVTRYHRRVGSLCYPCQVPGWDCDLFYTNAKGVQRFENIPCPDYCPYNQKVRNPSFSAAQAMAQCISDYANTTLRSFAPFLNASLACDPYGTYFDSFPKLLPGGPFVFKPSREYTVTTDIQVFDDSLGWCNNLLVGTTISPTPNPLITLNPGIVINPIKVSNSGSQYQVADFCLKQCQYDAETRPGEGFFPCGGGHTSQANTQPDSPYALCGLIQVVQNFLDVFNTFTAIFTTPLIEPPDPVARSIGPVRRESFQQFRERIHFATASRTKRGYEGLIYFDDSTEEHPNFAQQFASALYDYDTSDCYDDPVACACRNLDLSQHCEWVNDTVIINPAGRLGFYRRNDQLSTLEMTQMLHMEEFTGTTVCDHIFDDNAAQTWDAIHMHKKHQWVRCLDQRIQGSRLNLLNDVFPKDLMYNTHAPMSLVHNLYNKAKRTAKRLQLENGQAAARREYELEIERVTREAKKRFFNDPGIGAEGNEKTSSSDGSFNEWVLTADPSEELLPHDWEHVRREHINSAREYLKSEYGYTDSSVMMDAMVRFSEIHLKYQYGFYGKLFRKAAHNIQRGGPFSFPTTQDAFGMLKESTRELYNTVRNGRFTEMAHATKEATDMVTTYVRDVAEQGVGEHISSLWERYTRHRESMVIPARKRTEDAFEKMIYEAPLVKWWSGMPASPAQEAAPASGGLIAFVKHMWRVVEFQRTHWQSEPFSFYSADLRFWSFKDILLKRWQNPIWNAQKLANWDRFKRLYWTIYGRIWPNDVPEKERAFFLSRCDLLEQAADITLETVSYCAARASAQQLQRNDSMRVGRNEFRWERWSKDDPKSAIYLRFVHPPAKNDTRLRVDHRAYRSVMEAHGPARWDLYSWLLSVFEDITKWTFRANADTWLETVQNWLENPNTDVTQFPDVGLLFYFRLIFTCPWPQALDCRYGVGLETALLWVSVGFIALIGVSQFIPFITLPIQIVGFPIAYVVVLFFVAYLYSPGCAFRLAAPMCIGDDVMRLADKYITNCYSPLIIPSYMISGELCPVDPNQSIDVLNCRDLGIGDGIQNVIYLGYLIFGTSFLDWTLSAAAALANVIPVGLYNYFEVTVNLFRNAGPTQQQRLYFCFWANLPAALPPLGFIFLVIAAFGGVFVALFLFLRELGSAIWGQAARDSPANDLWKAPAAPNENIPPPVDSDGIPTLGTALDYMSGWFIGEKKERKKLKTQ